MRTYQAKYTEESKAREALKTAEEALVTQYVWGGEYQPKNTAKLVWTEEAFHYSMCSIEKAGNMRAVETGISPVVHKDSCLEFFFSPLPESRKDYINIEINPIGGTFIAIGLDRHDRILRTDLDLKILQIENCMEETDGIARWGFTARIPYTLIAMLLRIETYLPPTYITANFYKCGDATPQAHYGVWNAIGTEQPDYHRPEFFGKIELCR